MACPVSFGLGATPLYVWAAPNGITQWADIESLVRQSREQMLVTPTVRLVGTSPLLESEPTMGAKVEVP